MPLKLCKHAGMVMCVVQIWFPEATLQGILTLQKLSQLQLIDLTLPPHRVHISPVLLRTKACGQCVGCLQSNNESN